MKRNYIARRLMSLTLSAMLTVSMAGGLFVAEAATVPVGTTGTPAGTAGVVDVFYFDAVANVDAGAAVISGFETDKDYISVNAGALALSVTDDSGNAKVSVTDGATPRDLFVITGVAAASVKTLAPTDPVIFSVAEAGLVSNEVNQVKPDGTANTVTFTPTATLANGSTTGMTYEWKDGTTVVSNNKDLTIDTSAVAAGAHTYTLTMTSNGKSVTWVKTITVKTVDVCNASVSIGFGETQSSLTLDDGATATVPVTATATVNASVCNIVGHEASNHGKDLTVVLSTPNPPAGAVLSGTNLTIGANTPAGAIAVRATAGGVTKDHTVSLTRTAPVCNATLLVDFVEPTAAAINLNGVAGQTLNIVATAKVTGTCNVPGHTNENNHGKAPVITYSLKQAPYKVTINASNQLVIAGDAPSGNIVITANVSLNGATKTIDKTVDKAITFTRSAPDCNFVPNGFAYSIAPTLTGNVINADSTLSVVLTPTISGTGNSTCAQHPGDPFHGRTVTWDVKEKNGTAAPAWVTASEGADKKLTISFPDKSKLKPETNIVVTATLSGFTPAYTQEYKITRAANCNKVITGMGAVNIVSPSSGSSYSGGVLSVRSSTATVQITVTPTTSGTCEYETNSMTHPGNTTHSVAWSIAPKARNGSTAGVVIDSNTGLLTVTRSQLATVDTQIVITASGNGNSAVGNLVVRRSSSSDNSSNDSEKDRYDDQWDTYSYKLEDADTKDTVSISLGDNSLMPTHVIEEIVGRNVTAKMTVSGGFTWTVNGRDLKKTPQYQIYIGLGVDKVSNKDASKLAKYNDIEVLELEHSGSFYGTYYLKQSMSSKYRNKYVYLYKYDDDANKLYYRGSAKVNDDGYVTFPFTSASTYVITDRALYGEAAGSTGGTGNTGNTGGSGSTATVVPPASSTAPAPTPTPPPASSSAPSSSSSSSIESSEIEEPSSPSSSSQEVSQPADVEPEEEEKPEKKSIPLIVPILLVVVTITIVAVILLAKGGGMNIGG